MSQNAVVFIALGSLIVAIVTMVLMFLGQRHVAGVDYVASLEKRIETLERELAVCERKLLTLDEMNAQLLKKNILLLERLAGLAAE